MKNDKKSLFNNLNNLLIKVLLLDDSTKYYKSQYKLRLSQEWLDMLWNLGISGYYVETNNDLREDPLIKLGFANYFKAHFNFNYVYPTQLGLEYVEYALPQFVKYNRSTNDIFKYNRSRIYKTQQRRHEYNIDSNVMLLLTPVIISLSIWFMLNINTGLTVTNKILGLAVAIVIILFGSLFARIRHIYQRTSFLRLPSLTIKSVPIDNFIRVLKYQDNRISKASYLQFMIKHVDQINKQQDYIGDLRLSTDHLFMQNYGYYVDIPSSTDLLNDSDGALVDSMGDLTTKGQELEG